MPQFSVQVPHDLAKDEARSRLERFAEMLQQKHQDQVSDLSQNWNGDKLHFRFKTFGIQLEGDIEVQENALAVDGQLPFSAMMFRGKIESEIKEQLERIVAS